jgi:putative SOS response-associated peptidase YedK
VLRKPALQFRAAPAKTDIPTESDVRDGSGKSVETCSILTTTPNDVTSPVHDRMPVILDPDGYDTWLDPGMRNVADVTGEICTKWNERESTWRKSGSCQSRGTSQSKS